MIQTQEVLQTVTQSNSSQLTVTKADAHNTASQYVSRHLSPIFTVAGGEHYFNKRLGREIWQFIICCKDGPLTSVQVDAQTGRIFAFTEDEVRVICERAAIVRSPKCDEPPRNPQRFVLSEYARRQANGYLGDTIGMFFNAVNPVFIASDPPLWQVTIVFKRYELGPIPLGVMNVDAQTGEPIPLTNEQIKRMRDHVHAFVRNSTSPTTAS